MRLENFRLTHSREGSRVSADVVWEEAPRAPFELYYEVDPRFEADLPDDANAFLLSVAISASRDGERRIAIERPVCPRLAEGVTTALAILKHWYPGGRTLPRIETRAGFRATRGGADHAALCLTGGVDSMHTLLWNRSHYPAGHPRSFRRAVYVVHLSFPPGDAFPRARDVARRQMAALSAICEETDLDFCAVRTNVRQVEPTLRFTQAEGLSALLAAAAHFQAQGISSISIASSSYELDDLRPWGTHPLLDRNFSSGGLDVIHEDGGMPRTEKVERIVRWGSALRNLFVCFEGPLPDGRSNCGRCEKCLRTMTALLAFGGLDRAEAFGDSRVTTESLAQVPLSYEPSEFPFLWGPLARSMDETGHPHLAAAIRRRISQARRYLRWRAERDWRGVLRRTDRRLLGGTITALTRGLRGIATADPTVARR